MLIPRCGNQLTGPRAGGGGEEGERRPERRCQSAAAGAHARASAPAGGRRGAPAWVSGRKEARRFPSERMHGSRVGCRARALRVRPDLGGGWEAVYQALLGTIRSRITECKRLCWMKSREMIDGGNSFPTFPMNPARLPQLSGCRC